MVGRVRAVTSPFMSDRLVHRPAIDGLRGLAVVGVLALHGDLQFAQGGFLGVSTFFTLSGYLITSLLLLERERSGRVDLRRFYARRIRRLLPASLLAVAGVVVFGLYAADAGQLRHLRSDVLSSLANGANWLFVFGRRSYGDLASSPSPVQHFWSLAIEEQFYLVFPLVLVGTLFVARGSRRALAGLLVAMIAASILLMVVLHRPGSDPLRVYYGTDTRAAELLIGCLLAVVLAGRDEIRHRGLRIAAAATGAVALVATLALWVVTDQGEQWMYRGGFAGYAVLTAMVIVACTQPGPVRSALSWRPLRFVGAISYGLYLFHWPLFLWLDQTRTGLEGWPLLGVRLALTFGVAILSYELLEQPIRTGRRVVGRVRWVAPPAAVGVIALAAVLVVVWRPTPVIDYSSVLAAPVAHRGQSADADPVNRVLFIGSSLMTDEFPFLDARLRRLGIESRSVSRPATGLFTDGGFILDGISDQVATFDPDVVVIEMCCTVDQKSARGDVTLLDGRIVPADSPEMDAAWAAAAEEAYRRATARGARAFWVLTPPADSGGIYGPIETRIPRFNAIYRQLATTHPRLGLIDWSSVAAPDGHFTKTLTAPNGAVVTIRTEDGLHFTPPGRALLADTTLLAVIPNYQVPVDLPRPTTTTTANPAAD